jgi:hypothetical protein
MSGASTTHGTSCANATRPLALAPPWAYAYTSTAIHSPYSAALKSANPIPLLRSDGLRASFASG